MSASRSETFDKLFMASAKAKFPTDDSVRKVMYLAIQAASKKMEDAGPELAVGNESFIIEFGDRLNGHL